ncbi:MAG: hypothetical protein AAB962_03250 [Patescibacteria group bacterium]
MQNSTKQKLELFAAENNWRSPHPLDMERFYEFIIEAYNNGDTEISRDIFLEIINQFYKTSDDELVKWLIKFENGIGLLKVYNKNS